MAGPCRHPPASCSPCTAAGATRAAAAALGAFSGHLLPSWFIRAALNAPGRFLGCWSEATAGAPRTPVGRAACVLIPSSLTSTRSIVGSRAVPQVPPRAAMVAPTDPPAAAPAGEAAGPPYGLPPLPAIPCPDFRGPTPWSNWVIKGRLLAGARQGRGCAAGHGGLAAGGRALLGSTHQAAKCRSCPPPYRRLPSQPG